MAPVAGPAWIAFSGIDLGAGVASFTAQVSRTGSGEARIEVRLDDPLHGRLIGTAPVPSTGDRHTWTATAAPLDAASGVGDLYLLLVGEMNVASFFFASRGGDGAAGVP